MHLSAERGTPFCRDKEICRFSLFLQKVCTSLQKSTDFFMQNSVDFCREGVHLSAEIKKYAEPSLRLEAKCKGFAKTKS